MKFAVFNLAGQREDQDARGVLSRVVEQAEAAEDLGFEAIWLAEHHFTHYGVIPNPAVLGAAIAARTTRLRIGTGISVLPFHDPRVLAEDFAMLDVLSGGRLDFGVGRGYQPAEFAAMGIDQTTARERFAEVLAIVEGLWTTDDFTYRGKFFDIEGLTLHPKPIQDPPPIWMACVSEESFRIAAEAGRPFMAGPQITPMPIIQKHYALYHDTLTANGFDPSDYAVPLQRHVYCSATTEASVREPEDGVMWYQHLNAERMANADSNAGESYDFYKKAQRRLLELKYDDAVASGAFLFDTPDNLIRRIETLQHELGIEYLLCWMDFPGTDQKLVLQSMERFATEVMPHFAETDVH